jgi:hypothetical protein
MHLWLPMLLASVLAGAGTYGVLARRNAQGHVDLSASPLLTSPEDSTVDEEANR